MGLREKINDAMAIGIDMSLYAVVLATIAGLTIIGSGSTAEGILNDALDALSSASGLLAVVVIIAFLYVVRKGLQSK